MLLRIKDYVCDPQKFEKALVKSCAILTLRNMDETSISMIQPTIRLTLTDLRVKNSSVMNRGNRMTKQGALIGNSLCFDTTSQTSIDFKEHDTPLQKIRKTVEDYRQGVQSEDDLIVGNKSIFHTLILGEPVLSIGEHEEKVFYDLLRQGTGVITDEQNDVFLDQICSVTGVVIEAGEITNLGQNTRMFRLFLLTTRLQIAVVKVMERVVMFPGQNGKQKNVAGKLERIRQRLLAQRLTVARDPQTVVDKKDTVFIKCLHLQYDGFDELNKVHNFNTSSSRVVIRDCNMLQSLHKCLLNGILFAEGTGCALSYKALMSTGETDTDQICRAYAKALVQSKIKIYHLLNRYDDERALCEEMISNCR
ncbi:hypothetical protein BaOVIS_014530 [Babesia ovis]|uniref:Uncharacterized protein n=1 Tax=Babesia ovis TaxID=5869 RepID=A0A9W5T9L2_BABOV|nr:hypothetical protein BaOVIS_014530 [Babesia ovis]